MKKLFFSVLLCWTALSLFAHFQIIYTPASIIEASNKKVKVLSGGERTRLALLRLLLEPYNLLILDEPTNHLDMKTKEVLKYALQNFDGTLIVVSHDRDFLDGLVDKVYEFGGGKVVEHLEGIYEFMERKKLENLRELEK